MKSILVLLVVLATWTLPAAADSPCQPTGVLEVVNARLDATAAKDGEAIVNSPVAIYSSGHPEGKTKTDGEGHFVFDHLAPGRYDLVIGGLGSFAVEVNPHSTQQAYYAFTSTKGCLGAMMNTN